MNLSWSFFYNRRDGGILYSFGKQLVLTLNMFEGIIISLENKVSIHFLQRDKLYVLF